MTSEREFKDYAYKYLSEALDEGFPRIRNFFTDEEFEELKLKIVDINYQAFVDYPDVESVRNEAFLQDSIPVLFDAMLDKIINHNKSYDEGIFVALHKYLFNSEQFEKLKQLEDINNAAMKEQETREGNDLIATYIGVDIHYSEEVYKDSKSNLRHKIDNLEKSEGLKFRSSWDWLMEVVEKCCKEIEDNNGNPNGFWNPQNGYSHYIYSMPLRSPIDKVWKAVVDYIIQRNKLQKK